MKEESTVVFKGTGDGVRIVLSDKADFAEIMACLTDKIRSNRSFFKGGGKIRFTGRTFSKSDMLRLESVARTYIPDSVLAFGENDRGKETGVHEEKKERAAVLTVTLLERDVKPGEQLRVQGHMVIVGSVGENSDITAGGSIIVLGTAHGTLRAGYPSLESAYVIIMKPGVCRIKIGSVWAEDGIFSEADTESPVKLCMADEKIHCTKFS